MFLDGLSLDPFNVLGIARGASSQAIRDAYRDKSKKHHPDHGGDEWAFKIVARAYQHLLEQGSGSPGDVVQVPSRDNLPDTGRVRVGVHDQRVDPARMVAVEVLWVRYQVADVVSLLAETNSNRDVSGSLHLSWPDPDLSAVLPAAKETARYRKAIQAAFDEVRKKTRPVDAKVDAGDDRFEGWLSYRSGPLASAAFKQLQPALNTRALGVRQWTRDLLMERE